MMIVKPAFGWSSTSVHKLIQKRRFPGAVSAAKGNPYPSPSIFFRQPQTSTGAERAPGLKVEKILGKFQLPPSTYYPVTMSTTAVTVSLEDLKNGELVHPCRLG
jgi:hypothetical protein